MSNKAAVMKNGNKGKLIRQKMRLAFSMGIFGTIGIFRRYIPLGSATLAMCRGFIGMASVLGIMLLTRREISFRAIKHNLGVLFLSGAMIGLNWILLFESYCYTTVAAATLCYYMAPVFVILASPVVTKEKLTMKKLLCAAAALFGMTLVSGLWKSDALHSTAGREDPKGILLALGAAVLYAGVVLLNKRMKAISAYNKTLTQLGVAAAVILPYALLVDAGSGKSLTLAAILLTALVGVVHTGIAYCMYFSAMEAIPAQTVALFSYIDPILAVLLSALFLREPMGPLEIAGAVFVLAGTIGSEL